MAKYTRGEFLGFGAALAGVFSLAKLLAAWQSAAAQPAPAVAAEPDLIVVNARGFAVYDLTGDSKRHPKCTKANGCFKFWAPVTVSSSRKLSKAPGINGKLGAWHRNGFLQVTLGGHPVYRFALDTKTHAATGEGISSFHGTWHVIKASSPASGVGTTTSTTTTTGTTTTGPCLYPPCY